MPDPLSAAFAALADPTRRDIVERLVESDAGVTELAEPYGMSIQAISKHIAVLEDAGLVSRSRSGRRRPVHLEGEVLSMVDKWIERYARAAEARFQRLDAVLAETASQPDQISAPSRKDTP